MGKVCVVINKRRLLKYGYGEIVLLAISMFMISTVSGERESLITSYFHFYVISCECGRAMSHETWTDVPLTRTGTMKVALMTIIKLLPDIL